MVSPASSPARELICAGRQRSVIKSSGIIFMAGNCIDKGSNFLISLELESPNIDLANPLNISCYPLPHLLQQSKCTHPLGAGHNCCQHHHRSVRWGHPPF